MLLIDSIVGCNKHRVADFDGNAGDDFHSWVMVAEMMDAEVTVMHVFVIDDAVSDCWKIDNGAVTDIVVVF